MNNLPNNFNSELTKGHYPQCEDQPEGMPCICSMLEEQYEEYWNEPFLDEKCFSYNLEVRDVILEAIKL